MQKPIRLAVVVSHPIQYYVPLYRRLAKREDIVLKVFFTWHSGQASQYDPGFRRNVVWDIPLTDGYEYEHVPNTARRPGTDHFWGLRNPDLVSRINQWKADAVHITGYAYASHLSAMRSFHQQGMPVLFRGDSNLIGRSSQLTWQLKRFLPRRAFKWTAGCLYVGKNNYDYFRNVDVPEDRLFYCPHCIEVPRFSEPDFEFEEKARRWRHELKISETAKTLLFAGKFQQMKRPVQLMRAVAAMPDLDVILIMVGNGELEPEMQGIAGQYPHKFRLLPFQNQSRMPIVYRLGDVFVLPSASETWGLGVNEALACGRRVLISDKVGCGPDIVTSIEIGRVFEKLDPFDFGRQLALLFERQPDPKIIRGVASRFDVSVTEETLREALRKTVAP